MSASSPRPSRVLILGGSSDATALARDLVGRADIEATLSLAGRTKAPAAQPLPTRVGGFGGPDGLAAYLRAKASTLLVDATHPFAALMSANARAAVGMTGTPLIRSSARPGRLNPPIAGPRSVTWPTPPMPSAPRRAAPS